MSQQVGRVDTLFLHGAGDRYTTVVTRNGDRVLRGKLELKETDAGPRPGRFRVLRDGREHPRDPDEFVELARRAEHVRISEQTTRPAREELRAMLNGYQLDATVVRTCRYCANAERYSPVTSETAVKSGDDYVCRDCARRELDQELSYHGGLTGAAEDRLEELLFETGDLDRITDLLAGRLDPELTQFDVISPTVDEVDPVPVDDLDLHPDLAALLADRFETLLPVQSLAVEGGLLEGDDQLVVSATATGKTLVGELAGIDRVLHGAGKMLFLVPLVALANQKHEDFEAEYGDLVDVSIRVGASRIRGGGGGLDPTADVIVGTYEGIDHALRTGRDLGDVGTVVIDEVHNLAEEDRGHRLDGLISRLRHHTEQRSGGDGNGSADGDGNDDSGDGGDGSASTPDTQWVYLSATVGNPRYLAKELSATLVEFEERPVPVERHVTFADGADKPEVENKLVRKEFDRKSSKGYRGQTIIFTNSRRRCHEISRRLEYSSAPYHAGLDYGRRKQVERRFADQDLAAVVTTAALAAGVDFPASQVVFDSLAMGIEWLTVQEFHQMLGRAGRPDYHDRGRVYLLVEPDGVYHGSMERTEDEVAFALLKDEMEDVVTAHGGTAAVEETLANLAVAGKGAKRLNDRMLGEIPTKRALGKLLEYGFVDGLAPTDLGRVVTEHFLSPEAAFTMLDGVRKGAHPYDVVADVELLDEEE